MTLSASQWGAGAIVPQWVCGHQSGAMYDQSANEGPTFCRPMGGQRFCLIVEIEGSQWVAAVLGQPMRGRPFETMPYVMTHGTVSGMVQGWYNIQNYHGRWLNTCIFTNKMYIGGPFLIWFIVRSVRNCNQSIYTPVWVFFLLKFSSNCNGRYVRMYYRPYL